MPRTSPPLLRRPWCWWWRWTRNLSTCPIWLDHDYENVQAQIGRYHLEALINSGSTHNFLNEKTTTILQLSITPTTPFQVKVANGGTLKCQGRYSHIPLSIQGIPFSFTLYTLPSSGLNIVLGIQWLETLGTVTCNWKDRSMEFIWKDMYHKL